MAPIGTRAPIVVLLRYCCNYEAPVPSVSVLAVPRRISPVMKRRSTTVHEAQL